MTACLCTTDYKDERQHRCLYRPKGAALSINSEGKKDRNKEFSLRMEEQPWARQEKEQRDKERSRVITTAGSDKPRPIYCVLLRGTCLCVCVCDATHRDETKGGRLCSFLCCNKSQGLQLVAKEALASLSQLPPSEKVLLSEEVGTASQEKKHRRQVERKKP